jgi:tripartite-type tricarboxylate transporter receptor subunit TctC
MLNRIIASCTLLASLFAVSLLPTQAIAQTYPNRVVRLIVTYPAGGSSDTMARLVAKKLGDIWGHTVIVENQPGAGGSLGVAYAARQPADGYSFLIGNLGPVSINPLLFKVQYDMGKQFLPVSLIATGPNILVVNAKSPYKTLKDVVNAARSKPDSINYGSSGTGSIAHLGAEMLKRQANIKMQHIPYKGGVHSIQDLLAGHNDLVISETLSVASHIRSGNLRPLAVTSVKRSPMTPDVPTFAESGFPGVVADNWWGAFMPAGTPKPIVDKFYTDLKTAMSSSEIKEKFKEMGVEAVTSTSAEFHALINAETAKYAKLIKEADIRGE